MAGTPAACVVVPAHDEGAVLRRCLDTLLADSEPGEFDVVVVANACTDDTADVARRAGVRVVETPVPGKVSALRLGDDGCTAFPRVYLDADVDLDTASLRALVETLAAPGVLACAPRPRYDLARVGGAARRVHRVHRALMADRRGLAGAGAYALGRAGHARAFPLPDVISDDGWVQRIFAPHERLVVDAATSVVRPAPTVRAELRRRVRVRLGNRQLDRLGRPGGEPLRPAALIPLLRDGSVHVLDVACYLAVLVADRAGAALRHRSGRLDWNAESTRRGAAATAPEGRT